MHKMKNLGTWKIVLCALPLVTVAGALVAFDPFAQPLSYHGFADRRSLGGIPNFALVVSNLAFFIVGALGFYECMRHHPPGAGLAWVVFFAGFILTSFGSGIYHWSPHNGTLVWDRAAMAVAFAGLYAGLVAEYVSESFEKPKLYAVFGAALGSVLYWHLTDDLRFYFSVQVTVFATAAVILIYFENTFRQKAFVLGASAFYAVAVVLEQLDHQVFSLSGSLVAGHTLKHVMAGMSGYWIYRMLKARQKIMSRA